MDFKPEKAQAHKHRHFSTLQRGIFDKLPTHNLYYLDFEKKTEKWQTHKHRPFNILQRCIVDKLPAYFFYNQIFKVGPQNQKKAADTQAKFNNWT